MSNNLDDLLGDFGDGDLGTPPAAPPDAPSAAPPTTIESLAADIARQNRTLESIPQAIDAALQRSMSRSAEPARPVEPNAPPNVEELARRLNAEFLQNPAQFIARNNEWLKGQLIDEVKKSLVQPVADGVTSAGVSSFLAEKVADPAFRYVGDDFRKILENEEVRKGLTGLPPQQHRAALELYWTQAAGQAALASFRRRQESPPPYNAGSAGLGGGGVVTPPPKGVDMNKLSETQRLYIDSAREAGIPEERIVKQLADWSE